VTHVLHLSAWALRGAAAALLVALWANAALGHAQLRGTNPPADAVLAVMPDTIELRFSEGVGVLGLDWLLPEGRRIVAEWRAIETTLRVAAPGEGGAGSYALIWRVVSADGHPVAGSLVFSVGHASGAAPPEVAQASALPAVVLRGICVAALILAVGFALFDRLVAPVGHAACRAAMIVAALVLPAGLSWLVAEGVLRLGLPAGGALLVDALLSGFESPAHRSVILAALAAASAAGALWSGHLRWALVAWALAALSFAVSGHALSAPGWTAPLLAMAHGAAMILWLGMLPPLALAMAKEARGVALRRFSRLALPAVLALIASGAGLVALRRGAPNLAASDWAVLLGLKLALVAVMLGLALWHRQVAMPRIDRAERVAPGRTIWVEAAVGIMVLSLAMRFRLAPPPALNTALAEPLHLHGTQAMTDVIPSATPPGRVGFTLVLSDPAFTPLEPREVRVALTDAATGIGPLFATAQRSAAGVWDTDPITLPTPGPWQISITLRIGDFEQTTLSGELPLASTAGP